MDFSDKIADVRETYVKVEQKLEVLIYLQELFTRIYPNCELEPFGSSLMCVGLKDSDLNLVLYNLPNSSAARGATRILNECRTELGNCTRGFERFHYLNCQCPLLRFKCQMPAGLRIELSCWPSSDVPYGVLTGHLLTSYMDLDSILGPLVCLVKDWARHHDLLGPFERRLSTFSLHLMVVFYLQKCHNLPTLKVRSPKDRAFPSKETPALQYRYWNVEGHQLKSRFQEFLDFYIHFPWATEVISVRTGQSLTRSSCQDYSMGRLKDHYKYWVGQAMIESPSIRHNVCKTMTSQIEWRRTMDLFKHTQLNLEKHGTVESIYY